MDFGTIAFAIVTLIIGIIVGFLVKNSIDKKQMNDANANAEVIVDDAIRQAQTLKREALFEAKEENLRYRNEVEEELKERRSEITRSENRLIQKEASLDQKSATLDQRELNIEAKEETYLQKQAELVEKEKDIDTLIEQQQSELEKVAAMSRDEAQNLILAQTEQELEQDIAIRVRDAEQQIKDESTRTAKEIILQAIQRTSTDIVADNSVSVVHLPNDDMKGRIIGREGRNIKSFESLTGIDLIIDDTPDTVLLSGFDPIRREIAKIALEKLIQDGRIHPGRIEEMVERARKEVDERIREVGEEATFELGLHQVHPDLIKIIGRLAYRTSYGQNVLNHSVEVAKLTGYLAGELGEDVQLAKRAGLFHDIGKALDQEVEGTHVEIGVEIAKRYKEPEVVINSIASHHGDTPPTSNIAVLVAVADALSASRPGARSESLENYVRRLEQLEEIANAYQGVDHSYAIQAGRELRVIVKPNEVNDAQSAKLAYDIKSQVESEMTYPGNVKVTVIREMRAIEVAK
ncbi:ribonuclease Y [Suicoccus acidiformans]|uniref:Ribonuclease Y n=1 Tax=Suicoccus acidiformans TaxID=2036206 RepID=A0A347WLB4_9LACT|nr:ribonuclease Y [Suicoccus acidiformans]AXY25871.1 ribonuclease Y [Suicoccus acidiformans]